MAEKPVHVHIGFPLFLVSHPTFKANGVYRLVAPDGAKMLPVFTDEAFANEAIASTASLKGSVPWAILDHLGLYGALVLFEKKGVVGVFFDPKHGGELEGMPIEDLREMIENHLW